MSDHDEAPHSAPHSEDDDAPEALDEHEIAHKAHKRKDELLDEGVEETFPASDPVAVKHIT
jgi:hypothetical protein